MAGLAELAYVVVNISAMPVYILSIGLDVRWVGAVATAYLVMEGVMKSPFGLLGDRIGRRSLILVGPLVSCFTALLTPFIHHPGILILLRIVDGLGAAALWPSAFSLIGDHVPAEKRSAGMSLFNGAYMVGIALGPAIGGATNDWAQHFLHLPISLAKSASFYVASGIFALTFITAAILIPKTTKAKHDPNDLGPGVEGGFSYPDFMAMLQKLPMLLLMAFVLFMSVGLVMAYAKLFCMNMFDLSESRFGALLIGPALVIAVVSVPLGTLGDKIGKVRAVQIGIGTCMVAFWLLLAFPNQVMLILMGSLLGIGFVVAFPAWMAQVSEVCDPAQRGAAVGAVGTAQGLGAIVGVAISAFLYKIPAFKIGQIAIPDHSFPFLGCACMLTVSFIISVFALKEHPPHKVC